MNADVGSRYTARRKQKGQLGEELPFVRPQRSDGPQLPGLD
jgi:hypothetical protein